MSSHNIATPEMTEKLQLINIASTTFQQQKTAQCGFLKFETCREILLFRNRGRHRNGCSGALIHHTDRLSVAVTHLAVTIHLATFESRFIFADLHAETKSH